MSANKLIGLPVAALAMLACTAEEPADQAAVRAAYDDYVAALLEKDGGRAASLVDRNTISYYGGLLELALRGDADTVHSISILDKIVVLTIRHGISVDVAEQMTAETLFVHAVTEGWIGEQSVVNSALGQIVVQGSSATGVHIANGQVTPLKYTFHREDGRWGLDLTAIMAPAEQAFKMIIEQSGRTEDEFVINIIEAVSGEEVPDSVWEPMIK
jgi:hypothetical protein